MHFPGGAVVFAVLIAASMVVSPVLASDPVATKLSEHQSFDSLSDSVRDADGAFTGTEYTLRGEKYGKSNGNGNGGSPGNGGPPGKSGNDFTGPDSNVTIPSYIENATVQNLEMLSSLEQRAWVLAQLEDVDPTNRKEDRRLTDAFKSINESVRSYVDWSRVEASDLFGSDRSALQALRHVGADSTVSNATTALVLSDRSLATQSIADAEHVFEEFEDEVETPGQRRKAERQIENAKRALDRGDERRSDEKHGHNRDRQAIKHYEQAWKHAQKAIEAVDSEVGLSLSVSTGQHEPGNETITYPVSGTISAPSATVESVEIYVDGERHKTVNVSTSMMPGIPERFETELELATTEATVTVVARDESSGEEVSKTITLDAPGFADEVYDIELTDPESGAEISVTGEGIVKSDFVVDPVPAEENRSFYAGPFIHIRNFSDFESATVEMPLDDDVDPSDGNLSVYKWDQHDEKPWHAVETDVHVENGTAVATVDSFSYFSVFWVDNWNDAITDTVNLAEHPEYVANETEGSIEPIDLAFVIDESGSMGGARIQDAKASAKRFVGGLYEDDRAALVSFAGGATLGQSLTTDHGAVNASIDQLNAGGGTNTGAGLQKAVDELTSNGEGDTQEIILLADGGTGLGPDPVTIAQTADEHRITINTIGMGTGIDAQELTSIADATGGEFYQVSDSSELPEVFDRVEQNRISLVDSDEDGISDAVEDMELGMTFGRPGMVGRPPELEPDNPRTAAEEYVDGDATEFERVTYEDDGDPMVTAKMIDASVHPGSGESVRKEAIRLGVTIPSRIDAETKENVFHLRWGENRNPYGSEGKDGDVATGYAAVHRKHHVPAEGGCFIGCWVPGQSKHPDWLPDEDAIKDEDQKHILLENVEVHLHYSHDVATEDIPTEYELQFKPGDSSRDIHMYNNVGEINRDEIITQTDIVVSAPDTGENDYQWEELGILEANFDMSQDSPIYFEARDEDGTITIESDEPYLYESTVKTRFQETYDEAMNTLETGLIMAAGGGPLSSVTASANTLIVSGSYGTAVGAFVLEEGTGQLVNVAGGKSKYSMYHSAIYKNMSSEFTWTISDGDPTGGTMDVTVQIAGIGPSVVRVNDPLSDGQED